METEEAAQENMQYEENAQPETIVPAEEEYATKETAESKRDLQSKTEQRTDSSYFVNGLCVGVGIGCIATFVIMWVSVFFTPQLPSVVTYETLLSIFIYPLIYLLAVGLVALTAGVVREYYSAKFKG